MIVIKQANIPLKVLLILFIVSKAFLARGQVNGCTDPLANNYNASATLNDGSCIYNATTYTPLIKVDPISDSLLESSGLQMAGNFLWSFNDGGGIPVIYRIDTLTRTVLQTITLSGASNIDWEDIAFDGTNFYIGDFGNNANGARTDLKIYKFPLSEIPSYATNPNATIEPGKIQVINFSYGDQPQPPVPSAANNAKYDCEAMIADGGEIHLFTKNWIDLTTAHYVINSTSPGNYVLTPLETLATGYLVTAADIVPGKKLIALLGYQNSGFGNHYMHLLSGYTGGYYFNGNKRKLNLPDATVMGQGEGITFRDSVYGYISNEKFLRDLGIFKINVAQKLRSFNISDFISGFPDTYTFTGDGNWNSSANWSNNKMPPAIAAPGSKININPPAGKTCILNIPYTIGPNVSLNILSGKNFVIKNNLIIR